MSNLITILNDSILGCSLKRVQRSKLLGERKTTFSARFKIKQEVRLFSLIISQYYFDCSPKVKRQKIISTRKENKTPYWLSTYSPPPRPFQFDFPNNISSEDTWAFQVNGAASLEAKKEPIPFSLWWESAHYPSASLVLVVWSFVLLINFSSVFFSRAPLDLKICFFFLSISLSISMKKRPDAFFVLVFFPVDSRNRIRSFLPAS